MRQQRGTQLKGPNRACHEWCVTINDFHLHPELIFSANPASVTIGKLFWTVCPYMERDVKKHELAVQRLLVVQIRSSHFLPCGSGHLKPQGPVGVLSVFVFALSNSHSLFLLLFIFAMKHPHCRSMFILIWTDNWTSSCILLLCTSFLMAGKI